MKRHGFELDIAKLVEAAALQLVVVVEGSGAFSCDRLLTRPSHESISQVGRT
jgi:hypothetical protein